MKKEYIHFGVTFDENKTPKYMTKDNFYNKELYNESTVNEILIKEADDLYDMNMNYFNDKDQKEFNEAVNSILHKMVLIPVDNLNDIKGKKGIYILVLDDYRQIYIGQSIRDLKQRILRHFNEKIHINRVARPRFDTLPIDCFKPMDITRIYVAFSSVQKDIDDIEYKLIDICPNKFLLNKTIGGKVYGEEDLFLKLSLERIKKENN